MAAAGTVGRGGKRLRQLNTPTPPPKKPRTSRASSSPLRIPSDTEGQDDELPADDDPQEENTTDDMFTCPFSRPRDGVAAPFLCTGLKGGRKTKKAVCYSLLHLMCPRSPVI